MSNDVRQVLACWRASLQSCATLLQHLLAELDNNRLRLKQQGVLPFGTYTGKVVLWQSELEEEVAYGYLLHTLSVYFETIHQLQFLRLQQQGKNKRNALQSLNFERKRHQFLLRCVEQHLKDIEVGIQHYEAVKAALAQPVKGREHLKGEIPAAEYRCGDKQLLIDEPQLGVRRVARFAPPLIPVAMYPKANQVPRVSALIGQQQALREGQTLYFYADGSIKAEAYYQHGKLHGPWTFYSPRGVLLVRSWYVDGQQQGKSHYYYADGAVYSLKGYCDGMAHGEHVYYYADGTLKTRKHYAHGKLHGLVALYYANGQQQKEQHFVAGQLHGWERIWNEGGKLLVEVLYEHGRAVRTKKLKK